MKDKYPGITYADLFQLASATAIEVIVLSLLKLSHLATLISRVYVVTCIVNLIIQEAGGPKIPMKYGRVDVTEPEQCPPEGRLPGQCFQCVLHSMLYCNVYFCVLFNA